MNQDIMRPPPINKRMIPENNNGPTRDFPMEEEDQADSNKHDNDHDRLDLGRIRMWQLRVEDTIITTMMTTMVTTTKDENGPTQDTINNNNIGNINNTIPPGLGRTWQLPEPGP